MRLLHKITDCLFARCPSVKEFCFLFLPLALDSGKSGGLFNADIWDRYLKTQPNPLKDLPDGIDRQSKTWVKRLLHRRRNIRYFMTIGEVYRYYKSKYLQIPYWFPDHGTLLKSVFLHKAGTIFIPKHNRLRMKNRVAIDGGPASGDSSIALLECGANQVLAFEPSPCQRSELTSVIQRNNVSDKVDVVPFALSDQRGQITITDQYGKDFASETISIDEYCNGKDIGCIKLDIEGAEFPAIRGAEKTIARCHPILLICVYHRPEDIFEMPRWLHTKFPFYKFCIRDTEPCNRNVGAHLTLIAWP